MKNNVYSSYSDRFYYYLYDTNETIEMFGEDMLKEFGLYIDDKLLKRFKKNYEEFNAIQTEIKLVLEKIGKL